MTNKVCKDCKLYIGWTLQHFSLIHIYMYSYILRAETFTHMRHYFENISHEVIAWLIQNQLVHEHNIVG